MRRVLIPALLALAACGSEPVEKPAPWVPAAHLGPVTRCDTTALLDVALGDRELELDVPDTLGEAMPAPDREVELAMLQLTRAAHCDRASVPDPQGSTLALFQLSRFTIHHAAARGDVDTVLDVWAVAQTRRQGSILERAVSNAVELQVVDALELLAPQVEDPRALAEAVATLRDRRPEPGFAGEAWAVSQLGPILPLPRCGVEAAETSRAYEAAWTSDDPAAALGALASPSRWERALDPHLQCVTAGASVLRDQWRQEQDILTRIDALLERLDA